jgi:hypothetical protein
LRMAPRSRARKRERAIAIACGDSPDVFVVMERAYLSENGHDHDFLVANPRRRALAGLLVWTLPGHKPGRWHNSLFCRE